MFARAFQIILVATHVSTLSEKHLGDIRLARRAEDLSAESVKAQGTVQVAISAACRETASTNASDLADYLESIGCVIETAEIRMVERLDVETWLLSVSFDKYYYGVLVLDAKLYPPLPREIPCEVLKGVSPFSFTQGVGSITYHRGDLSGKLNRRYALSVSNLSAVMFVLRYAKPEENPMDFSERLLQNMAEFFSALEGNVGVVLMAVYIRTGKETFWNLRCVNEYNPNINNRKYVRSAKVSGVLCALKSRHIHNVYIDEQCNDDDTTVRQEAGLETRLEYLVEQLAETSRYESNRTKKFFQVFFEYFDRYPYLFTVFYTEGHWLTNLICWRYVTEHRFMKFPRMPQRRVSLKQYFSERYAREEYHGYTDTQEPEED